MSGELQIVFIYDTLRCRKEDDDPKDAILYFHPSDIAEERRISICGQLMGITHFLINSFSSPQILTLENGKFALRRFGQQYVLALGCSSITPNWLLEKQADILYSLTRFFHRDIQNILTKANLTSIMDHYIPCSSHHGDLFALTFGILPILYLPKSANNISLQASLLLHTCMTKKGALGGIVMHQNKVVGVDICQEIAQKLAFMQPYQLPPAEAVEVDFKIPAGVQIFNVYVSDRELKQLKRRAVKFQHPASCDPESTVLKEGVSLAIDSIREEEDTSEGFSEISSSLYFEALNRADSVPSSSPISECGPKSSSFIDANESVILSMKDGEKEAKSIKSITEIKPIIMNTCVHLNSGLGTNLASQHRSLSADNIQALNEEEQHSKKSLCSSLADPYFPYVLCNGKSISRYLLETASNLPKEDEDEDPINECHSDSQQFHDCSPAVSPSPEPTIVDAASPPTINTTSTPSSIRRPINLPLPLNLSSLPEKAKNRRWTNFDDLMSPINPPTFQPTIPVFQNFADDLKENEIREKLCTNVADEEEEESSNSIGDTYTGLELNDVVHLRMMNSFRKLSSHESSNSSFHSSSENEKMHCSLPSSSKSTLPSYTNFKKKEPEANSSSIANVLKDDRKSEDEQYEKAYLYIYSHGSMRLLVLMDGDQSLELNVVQSLWEYGSVGVSELEMSISNVEEQGHTMEAGQIDPYCYLRYETIWKSLAYGGRNHSMDFDIVQLMHRDFTTHPNMNELIIRGEDHVVYGYQCVGSEVYYQQSANVLSGLPLASDLMGKVPQRAKNFLERDHNIILL